MVMKKHSKLPKDFETSVGTQQGVHNLKKSWYKYFIGSSSRPNLNKVFQTIVEVLKALLEPDKVLETIDLSNTLS